MGLSPHLHTRAVFTLRLLDTLFERLGLISLRGSQVLAVSRPSVVGVAHAISHGTRVRRRRALQFVTTASLRTVQRLVVATTKRRKAGSL